MKSSRCRARPGAALAVVLAGALVAPVAQAHEPLFGLGPHTLYQGGYSIGVSGTRTLYNRGGPSTVANASLTYGLTADLNLAVGIPWVIRRETRDGRVKGIGDPVLEMKWRALAHRAPGVIDALALVGALQVPAGEHDVSSGNAAYVFGVTAAREQLHYYLFSTLRYVAQTAGVDGKPGDVFLYDAAVGVRPVLLHYTDPDVVFLVEFNGMTARAAHGPALSSATALTGAALSHGSTSQPVDGPIGVKRQAHSGGVTLVPAGHGGGGTELAITPEVLLSWRNVMLKGGIQLPVFFHGDLGSPRPRETVRMDLIVEF